MNFQRYTAKYNYIYNDIFLIAKIDPNSGKQWLVMQKVNLRTGDILLEDRIQCIHTAVTTISPKEFDEKINKEEFKEDLLKIRSTENLTKIDLDLDEKFFAFKSWVAGIAEAGAFSITIQSDIERFTHLLHPIANRLFNFLLRAKADFIKQFLIQMERECRLDGEYHKPSIHANILKLLPIMILEEKEAWNIWRDRVETNYSWSERWQVYLINQFDEMMDLIYDLQPSSQIFLEEDKFHFILMLPKSKSLNDWKKTTHNSVIYDHKFIFPYKNEENGLLNLELWGKKIPKISAIQNFKNLKGIEVLHLEVNWIEKIRNLDHFVNLKQLYISNNYITKIEGLEKLKNLEVLKLAYNKIKKIEGLEKLNKLKKLYLFNNKIKIIEGLETQNELEVLNLAWNDIDNITGIEKLKNLRELNLGGNRITNIEGLKPLKSLERLFLFNNQIMDDPNLNFLPNLKEIDLRDNAFNQK